MFTAINYFKVSGAFVAGLDAGLVYNSFPLMAGKIIPSDIFAYAPWLSNFTENPTTVQFDHRILGTSTLAFVTYMALKARNLPLHPRYNSYILSLNLSVILGLLNVERRKNNRPNLTITLFFRTMKAVAALTFFSWMQVGLGITTLLAYVPVSIAAMHQANALITLSSALWLSHEVKNLKFNPQLAAKAMKYVPK